MKSPCPQEVMWLGVSSEKQKYRNQTLFPRSGRGPHLWHNSVLFSRPRQTGAGKSQSISCSEVLPVFISNHPRGWALRFASNNGRNKDTQCQKTASWQSRASSFWG